MRRTPGSWASDGAALAIGSRAIERALVLAAPSPESADRLTARNNITILIRYNYKFCLDEQKFLDSARNPAGHDGFRHYTSCTLYNDSSLQIFLILSCGCVANYMELFQGLRCVANYMELFQGLLAISRRAIIEAWTTLNENK